MRGHGTSVMPITAGCRRDVERLLKMYNESETLRYKPFIELFDKMKFATIFMGRMSAAELYEVSYIFASLCYLRYLVVIETTLYLLTVR